ncbi:PD-(D/E)XK nuclease family protein [Streptomyces gibsoniae]|uniref:PD-(D/E)XK nuclease family protein n=1 Tax=Streptomyces gibsoniae TaxID=3075529 RepID=A0ABU2TUZ3_9ACTN|nr:PD-(D/E)XK nuclease family protein [Streptomyces sp. DSM 41699]MDT0464779.1 PD-(D/E)XK nuclease family protein [Streptomyces sp. DSM 41699]
MRDERPDEQRWSTIWADLERHRTARLWMPGPSTVMDVLQTSRRERSHQLLIGWLLDPRQPHDLGTALLTGMLAALGKTHLVQAEGLARVRVDLEVVKPGSRADIVISTSAFKLVVELKVYADEGRQQTKRLADDHTQQQELLLVFLTLHGDDPSDERFTPMSLRTFAGLLRRTLEQAPAPLTSHTRRGRKTAGDLLNTLERMTGMAPADQTAARIWLAYGEHLPSAKAAARDVLKQLPAAVAAALNRLDLSEPVKVVGPIPYQAVGHTKIRGDFGRYPELAVLLVKPGWCTSDGIPLAGIGYGTRAEPDPFDFDGALRPFLGIRAEDPGVNQYLSGACDPQERPFWDQWPRWEEFDLTLPGEDNDLVEAYSDRAAARITALWERNHTLIDQAVALSEASG